ncbi:MAG: NADH-quinone oxidoreductase subunit M [Pseudomonadota bacterium]
MNIPILTIMTFFPLVGAAIIPFLPRKSEALMKWMALLATVPSLLCAVWIYGAFDCGMAGMQFVEGPFNWIAAWHIQYSIGIDGLATPMALLTQLIGTIAVLASWKIDRQLKGYLSLLLLLQTGMTGVFVALDFFLFYIFWELMLLPMYFLIGIWGGPRREYAAIKFFLYTLLGSVMMLLVMIAMYFYSEGNTFSILALANQSIHVGPLTSHTFRFACWLALMICFAIKVPVFPFHTWLPDAHVEAPTAISVILAGILLKMGIYGMLRFCYPMFPDITFEFVTWIALFGVINIIYGALCAMAQKDFKRLVAYSSISHMGFCLLGMASFTSAGLNGAVLQMFNHGTITAQLFLIVGIIYDRAHHRDIDGFGGLAKVMPRYAAFTAVAFFAALGLPGLSGFISEVLVFIGAFRPWPWYTAISAFGVVLTAAYILWTYQRVFLGKVNEKYKALPDISAREMITLIPLVVIVVVLGVYPKAMLSIMEASLAGINAMF